MPPWPFPLAAWLHVAIGPSGHFIEAHPILLTLHTVYPLNSSSNSMNIIQPQTGISAILHLKIQQHLDHTSQFLRQMNLFQIKMQVPNNIKIINEELTIILDPFLQSL